MESCSKCAGMNCVKDGVVKDKQRYLCKECGYRHTVPFRGVERARPSSDRPWNCTWKVLGFARSAVF